LKLAAIDIGSNAIRFQITNVIDYDGTHTFKRLEYVRFPLRLGKDVFEIKRIGEENKAKFFKLMQAFKILIDLYEVDDYYACATSAMRESENGSEIVNGILDQFNLDIHIIDGDKEAELINSVVMSKLNDKNYLHIDVGGGSTELNIIHNNQMLHSMSFKLGSVRKLSTEQNEIQRNKIANWIKLHIAGHQGFTAVGTGGNINKAFDLSNQDKSDRHMSISNLTQVQSHLAAFTLDERIHQLRLNEDRADVIIPALDIYLHAMKSVNCTDILVPDVGLKDGLMNMLYQRNQNKNA
jgi:exopolyphosphatase / guanosine-5'-triphosphate,3'-diphosphate pyrophosphatase